MKRKSKKLCKFIDNLHEYIVSDDQYREKTQSYSEGKIQGEIRPLIIGYLREYFKKQGVKDFIEKANRSFYWEGQEGHFAGERNKLFSTMNYPDFIILHPYLIAVEYKKNKSGSLIKHGIGQSIMYTLSGEFHYTYYFFHDETKNKSIYSSLYDEEGKIKKDTKEYRIVKVLRDDFNVFIKID